MTGIIHYLETGSVDPDFNLAFEEHVLLSRRDATYLMLWQNDNTIVLGQNQNAEAEIDQRFVREHGIRVARRTTGGGAVYHDLGNLNYSFMADAGKVSGTAQRLAGGRVLHHGTLLFDSDPSLIAGALRVDPQKFRAKRAQSVRGRIGIIRECLARRGCDMTLPEFWAYLKEALAGDGLVPDELDDGELDLVRRLKAEKYDSWEWVFGRSPAYDLRNRRWWSGGELEVRASITRERIADIRFFGDFLSLVPLGTLTDELVGCPYRRDAVREVLERQAIGALFGGITMEEVLSTVFPA